MITLIPKLILFRLFYLLGFPKVLPISYTISVTNKCNSRCKTCSVYKIHSRQMNVSEYRRIFKSIGRSPYWVTISGGEPFLRKDLPEIIIALDKYCRPKIINIPTNGILVSRIVGMVKQICKSLPNTRIIVNLSIDEIGEEHDKIRNSRGNYQKAMNTYKSLRKLRFRNLSVGIHTVISKCNIKNFPAIASTLIQMQPDSYITEVAEERKEMMNIGSDITPSDLEYRSAIDFLLHRIRHEKYSGMSRITQAFRIEYYNLVKRILRDKTQVIPCYAGISSCQIAPNGDVWFCCTKARPVGNLIEKNYSFRKVWFSRQAGKERRGIKRKHCYCPLANASYTNLMMHLPSLWRVFYRSFIKW